MNENTQNAVAEAPPDSVIATSTHGDASEETRLQVRQFVDALTIPDASACCRDCYTSTRSSRYSHANGSLTIRVQIHSGECAKEQECHRMAGLDRPTKGVRATLGPMVPRRYPSPATSTDEASCSLQPALHSGQTVTPSTGSAGNKRRSYPHDAQQGMPWSIITRQSVRRIVFLKAKTIAQQAITVTTTTSHRTAARDAMGTPRRRREN